MGVPQGSTLSPTMFNIYLTPLAPMVESFGANILSYADDIQLLFAFKKDEPINQNTIKHCLSVVFQWLGFNQLKCNTNKTQILSFGHIFTFDIQTH